MKPVGFQKPKIHGKGSFIPPNPKSLDQSCVPGDYVKSETIGGVLHQGILIEWDSNVAIIQLDDGGRKAIEC
jgi:hypothetical protein